MPIPRDRREPVLTRTFLLLTAAHFLSCMAFNLFLHLPGFLHRLGAGEVEIGVIFAVAAVAAVLARPPIGRLMDARGRREVILVGATAHAVVTAGYLTVTALGPWLYLVRVAHGLAEAVVFTAMFTLAADVIPASRRTEGIALFGVSGLAPVSLSGALGDAILARGTYNALFRAAFAFALLGLLFALPLRDPRPARGAHAADAPPRRGYTAAVTTPELLPIWFVGLAFSLAIASYFTFLKTYVITSGRGSVGLFFTAYSVAAVLLRLLFASVPERVGPKRALFPALVLLCAGCALLAVARADATIASAGVLCGLGHGFTFPILSGLVVTRARASERGAAMSVFTALSDTGVLLGGPLLGAVVRVAGYPAMFFTAAALVAAGALGFAVWDRDR